MKLELISFALCPFVQRSVITLKYKKADFKLTYIDLKNKPQWFLNISPMGRVPVLRVDETTSIFESAVINEFLDETVGKPLMSSEPLQRALERSWIQFGSELIMSMYVATMAKNNEEMDAKISQLFADLAKVQVVLGEGPYFRGTQFSLVDTSWAPLFMRLFLSSHLKEDRRWSDIPRVRQWGEELMKVPAVQQSVLPDFADLYVNYCRAEGSLMFANERGHSLTN